MNKSCTICKREFATYKESQKYCSRACMAKSQLREPETCLCKACGKEFKRKRTTNPDRGEKNEYCSRACAYEGRKAKTAAKKETKYIKIKKQRISICTVCGREFNKKNISATCCSDVCRYEKQKENQRNRYIRKTVISIDCAVCGKQYQAYEGKGGKCPHCTRAARKAREKAQRRSLLGSIRTETITIKALYRRDGGICQLCGKKTNINKNHNHDLYPSIDHIVPLSQGGEHTYSNVQLAHRICNSIKSNQSNGDQLRLC